VSGQELDAAVLKAQLGRVLPDYMVPAALVVLEALPLSPNGKVDRKALPEAGQGGERDYEAPQGELEEALAAVWSQVLGVERIGRHDNFFELGGHSLLALRMRQAIAERLQGRKIALSDLFAKPTVAELAQQLNSSEVGGRCLPLNNVPGAHHTLFMLHDGWGSVLDYASLAKSLGSRRWSVVGLTYETHCMKPPADLLQLAAWHASAILDAGPAGPIRLAGWSLGGTLAPLVAHALECRGHVVDFVGAIDPFVPPAPDAEMTFDFEDELIEFLGVLLPPWQQERLQQDPAWRERLADVRRAPEKLPRLLRALLAHVPPTELHEYGSLGAEELSRMFEAARVLRAAGNKHHAPAHLAAPLRVWWSQDRPDVHRQAFADWIKRDVPLEASDLAADHFQAVRSPVLFDQMGDLLQSLR
jgi:thioesterase domain-containing protein